MKPTAGTKAEPLLHTLFSHLERGGQPKNRQEELMELIEEDVKGSAEKKDLLEDCGLVSKFVVKKYQKTYPVQNKFRN